jgi:hypothetical protein
LKCKLIVGLLEDTLFHDELCMKLPEAEQEFQSTFDHLLQFEEQEQNEGHARLQLAQEGKEEQAGEDDDALVVADGEEIDVFAE